MVLHVESNCPDTDFIAKLIEELPDGSTIMLMDGVLRAMYRETAAGPQPLVPSRIYPLTIDLGDIHHTFRSGSRIEIDISKESPVYVGATGPATLRLAGRYADGVVFNYKLIRELSTTH